MDSRIGPPREWNDLSCHYNTHPSFDPSHECNKKPVVRHFMFKDLDENGFHPGTLMCEQHEHTIPTDLILYTHPCSPFCSMDGSVWDFELNVCTMPLDTFEKALFGEEDFAKDLLNEFETTNNR